MSLSTACSNGTTVHSPGDNDWTNNSGQSKRTQRILLQCHHNFTKNTPTNRTQEVSRCHSITKQIINTRHYFKPNHCSSLRKERVARGLMIAVPFPEEAGHFATTSSHVLKAYSPPKSIEVENTAGATTFASHYFKCPLITVVHLWRVKYLLCTDNVSDRKWQSLSLDTNGLSRYHLVNRNNRIITSAKMGLTLTLVLFRSMACLNCDSYS